MNGGNPTPASIDSPRVLLSAYQCGPGMGSVSQIGWEWYARLAKRTPVTLVTHIRNRECLQKAGAPLPGSEVIYIDTEWFAGPLYRTASRLFPRSQHAVFLISSADFYLYDAVAVLKLSKRRNDWDIVHAVTPVSPMASTGLHRLGLPLIVGPWNGGLDSPKTFPEIMRAESAWVYRIRGVGRILDRILGCTRHARLILSATKATDSALPAHARSRRMLENGVDLDVFYPSLDRGARQPPNAENPLRILFTGRLIPVKGISMLLEAVRRVRGEIPCSLTIVGDGPIRADLEREAKEKDLAANVRFLGSLPLDQVAGHMREAHVFCLPSVRESGGAVLLESLACGVPILALNYGGPGEIVDSEVGRALASDGPEALIADMVAAFRDVWSNPEEWRRRGEEGRRRAEAQYGWEAKIGQALEIYREAISIDVA
jgi:glycosyltransferase involved in cell wall biosynthesis